MNALPEPDFKYFSNSKALYLFAKQTYVINLIGSLFLVAGTLPLLCLSILSFRLDVQPVYGELSAHNKI